MKRNSPLAAVLASIAVAATLSACSPDDAATPETSDPSSMSVVTTEPMTSPDTEITAGQSESAQAPATETSSAGDEYQANDNTQICADLAEKSAPILMEAMENAGDPAAMESGFNELATLYEDAVDKVEDPEAKEAFTALAEAYRAQAEGGDPDSAMINAANEKFGAACFG